MNTDRLAEFRAAWRDEVSRRNRVPERPRDDESKVYAAVQPEASLNGKPLEQLPVARSTQSERQDTLNGVLEPLVEAHEKAALAGETYTTYYCISDASFQPANGDADDDASHREVDDAHDDAPQTAHQTIPIELPYRTVHALHAADESTPMSLAKVPEEVMFSILKHVVLPSAAERTFALTGPDYTSLERVARTCWYLRLLSARQSLWSIVTRYAYAAPQTPLGTGSAALLASHAFSWRNVFLFQPRVRLNGSYIASMRYLRTVQNPNNVWVSIIHSVDYYRLLRFYPDGRCVMLLTTDPPSEAVHQIGNHGAVGNWRLVPDQGKTGPQQRLGAMVFLEDMRDSRLPRYTLHMTLYLEQTSAGRWNRLELIDYASRNNDSGEVQPFPHRHKRPFWFSRVRSYGV